MTSKFIPFFNIVIVIIYRLLQIDTRIFCTEAVMMCSAFILWSDIWFQCKACVKFWWLTITLFFVILRLKSEKDMSEVFKSFVLYFQPRKRLGLMIFSDMIKNVYMYQKTITMSDFFLNILLFIIWVGFLFDVQLWRIKHSKIKLKAYFCVTD